MPERRFREGDPVEFPFGIDAVRRSVEEDRRPVGTEDRHPDRLEFRFDAPSDLFSRIELPAEHMQLVRDQVSME